MFAQFMAVQRKCTKNIVLCSRFGRRVMRGIKTPECDFSDSSIWWQDVTSLFYLLNSRPWPFNLLSSALTILGGKLFIWKMLPLFRLGTKRQGQSILKRLPLFRLGRNQSPSANWVGIYPTILSLKLDQPVFAVVHKNIAHIVHINWEPFHIHLFIVHLNLFNWFLQMSSCLFMWLANEWLIRPLNASAPFGNTVPCKVVKIVKTWKFQ